jgi:hypothetical protein
MCAAATSAIINSNLKIAYYTSYYEENLGVNMASRVVGIML